MAAHRASRRTPAVNAGWVRVEARAGGGQGGRHRPPGRHRAAPRPATRDANRRRWAAASLAVGAAAVLGGLTLLVPSAHSADSAVVAASALAPPADAVMSAPAAPAVQPGTSVAPLSTSGVSSSLTVSEGPQEPSRVDAGRDMSNANSAGAAQSPATAFVLIIGGAALSVASRAVRIAGTERGGRHR